MRESATSRAGLHRLPQLPSLSPAVRHGIRLGVATAAALWLAYAAGLPQPTWPLITVLMVAQPTAGGSAQKGIRRMIGSLLAGIAATVIYGLFGQAPLLFAIAICTVYGVGIYAMNGPGLGYAWNVFAFTSGIILGDSLGASEQVEIIAFDRVTLVMIGLFVSLLAAQRTRCAKSWSPGSTIRSIH